jgi:hypothetical protein
VTLNGFGKYYSYFHTSIAVRKTFPNFQDLTTLFLSEEMRIVVFHPMEDHNKMFYTQILIEVEVEVVKAHFKVDTKVHMVEIINMKVNLMEVEEETLKEEEVMEVVVEVFEVNDQIATQIGTTVGNMGTWQRIVIKRSMMHEMESYNKGIVHQVTIKVMNNCL